MIAPRFFVRALDGVDVSLADVVAEGIGWDVDDVGVEAFTALTTPLSPMWINSEPVTATS